MNTRLASPSSSLFLLTTALLAACAPSLLAYNVAPSPTFLNQALAFAAWGWFVIAAADVSAPARGAFRAAGPLLLALGGLGAGAAWSWGPGELPSSLALSALGTLLATAVLTLGGAAAAAGARAVKVFSHFSLGWVLAGVCGAALGVVQVFAPDWADGEWIARSSIVGRAVGNLRQPNHLSSLLLWSCVALVALLELGRLKRTLGTALFGLMVFAVVLTASRTGLVSVLLLALWGLLDRRLATRTRWLLLAAPLLYLLAWLGMAAWADASEHRFGGAARLAETDISGSRFGVWANALTLVARHPWSGVGFGEFNFAWSLTAFAGRPTAFFDHAHNLPLHLAAELGVPLATLIMGLLLWALWRAARLALVSNGELGLARRCAVMLVLMIGLHSLLEYPLWYAYFLLPAAWAFGFGLGERAPHQDTRVAAREGSPGLMIAGALLVAGSALSVLDYLRVTAIFAAPEGAPPLAQRIAAGQRSVLFSHHADYAAATTAPPGQETLAPFAGAAHYLLDTRLMTAWATALSQQRRDDEARHLAQRLREFRNPLSEEFFEPCGRPEGAPPFQCLSPDRALSWRDFLR